MSQSSRYSKTQKRTRFLLGIGCGILAGIFGNSLRKNVSSPPPFRAGAVVDIPGNSVAAERDRFRALAQEKDREIERLQQYKSDTIIAQLNARAKKFAPPSLPVSPDTAKLKKAQLALDDVAQAVKLLSQASALNGSSSVAPVQIGTTPVLEFRSLPATSDATLSLEADGKPLPPPMKKSPTRWAITAPLTVAKVTHWSLKGQGIASSGGFLVISSGDADLRKRFSSKPVTLGIVYRLAGQPERARQEWRSVPKESAAYSLAQSLTK